MGARKGNQNGKATQFQPGESGNPAGRPSVGASTSEWFAYLWHEPREVVKRIMEDEKEPEGKRWTAEMVLSRQGGDFDRIMNRTVGLPAQSINMKHEGEIPIKVIIQKPK